MKKFILVSLLLVFSFFCYGKDFVRILHITDLHIDVFNLFSKNYVKNVEILRDNIMKISPDVVVLTGDIVEFGEGVFSDLNYHILRRMFYSNTGFYFYNNIPLYMVLGNHEYQTMFKLNSIGVNNYLRYVGDRDYFVDINDIRLIFVDTGSDYYFYPWRYNGVLPEPESSGLTDKQLKFLEDVLSDTNKLKIIFSHHPFINFENGHVEGIFVFNRDRFYRLVKDRSVLLIVSGHVHKNVVYDVDTERVEKSFPLIVSNGLKQVITGSIGKDGFFRVIDVYRDKVVIYSHSNVVEILEGGLRSKF